MALSLCWQGLDEMEFLSKEIKFGLENGNQICYTEYVLCAIAHDLLS